jgi:hypothetical protein
MANIVRVAQVSLARARMVYHLGEHTLKRAFTEESEQIPRHKDIGLPVEKRQSVSLPEVLECHQSIDDCLLAFADFSDR